MATEYPVNPVHGYPYRAEKMSEGIRQAWEDYALDCLDKWMAFRFVDGTTDARLYENKDEAIRWQPREQECCYLPVPPSMGIKECDAYLRVHEEFYDGGYRIADPDKMVPARHLDFSTQRSEEWQNHGLITPRSRLIRPKRS